MWFERFSLKPPQWITIKTTSTWNIMLCSAHQQGACLHVIACWGESFNYTFPVHTACSTESNKVECQSQTHLWVRCRISDYVNQWYWAWMETWHCDGFSLPVDEVRSVCYGVNVIKDWVNQTLLDLGQGVLEQGIQVQTTPAITCKAL